MSDVVDVGTMTTAEARKRALRQIARPSNCESYRRVELTLPAGSHVERVEWNGERCCVISTEVTWKQGEPLVKVTLEIAREVYA